jgi:hypothetical protein
MTSPAPRPDQVDTTEIAGLLAWARSLTQAGRSADPADRASYLTAKTALLSRISNQDAGTASTKDNQ